MTTKTIGCIGQSNMLNFFTVASGAPTPNVNVRQWINTAWFPPSGNGACELGNDLISQMSGSTIQYLCAPVGGTSLCSVSNVGAGYWLDTGATAPLQNFFNIITAAGVVPDAILWHQGETDGISTNYQAYFDGLNELYARILRFTGKTSATLPFVLNVVGPSNLGGNISEIRRAQIEWVTGTPGARVGAYCYDLPTSDGMHFTASSYQSIARRAAKSLLKLWGFCATDGQGPKLSIIQHSGASIRLGITHNAGTGIFTGNAQADVGGFDVLAGGSAVSKKMVQIMDASTIQITLDSDPGQTVQVRYGYGQTPANLSGNSVGDNANPFGDAYGLPLCQTSTNLSA